ncbi:MAG: hypothetical protein ACI4VL_06780 [Bacilli bacterium]
MPDIEIDNINVEIDSDIGELEIDSDVLRIVEKDHKKLENLDYEKSGHKGFASAKNIEDINNKLIDFVKDSDYVHTDNNYTNEDKEKLEGLSKNAKDIVFDDDDYGWGVENIDDAINELMYYTDDIDNRISLKADKGTIYTTSYTIREYLDKNFFINNNNGEYIIQSTVDKQVYYVQMYYANVTLSGTTYRKRVQIYYSLSNPSVIYTRVGTGTSNSLTPTYISWSEWQSNSSPYTELGVVSWEDYQRMEEYMDELYETGNYHFQDDADYFDYYVSTINVNNNLYQTYWSSEEKTLYFRFGMVDESSGQTQWLNAFSSYMSYEIASNSFATKNHYHFLNVSYSGDIRTYLDNWGGMVATTNMGNIRVTIRGVDIYIVEINTYTDTTNKQYNIMQRYYSIKQPHKIYSRAGTSTTSSYIKGTITWGGWYVNEGILE